MFYDITNVYNLLGMSKVLLLLLLQSVIGVSQADAIADHESRLRMLESVYHIEGSYLLALIPLVGGAFWLVSWLASTFVEPRLLKAINGKFSSIDSTLISMNRDVGQTKLDVVRIQTLLETKG